MRGIPKLQFRAVSSGACGVAFGHNFQSGFPAEMASALGKIVHDGFTDREALLFYRDHKKIKAELSELIQTVSLWYCGIILYEETSRKL